MEHGTKAHIDADPAKSVKDVNQELRHDDTDLDASDDDGTDDLDVFDDDDTDLDASDDDDTDLDASDDDDTDLDASDLVDVVLDQLGGVELHLAVHGALPEEAVMVVVLIIARLDHGHVPPGLLVELVVVALLNGQLGDVVVHRLLAGGATLQQPDRIVGGVDIIQGRMGLTPIGDYCFHYIHPCHSRSAVELLDLLAVGVLQEGVEVVLGRGLVRVPHVGKLV